MFLKDENDDNFDINIMVISLTRDKPTSEVS